jgi:hypothetical protein
MGSTLLVTHQDMPYLRILRQRIIKREQSPTRETEHDVDALGDKAFTDYLGTRLFHGSAPLLLNILHLVYSTRPKIPACSGTTMLYFSRTAPVLAEDTFSI